MTLKIRTMEEATVVAFVLSTIAENYSFCYIGELKRYCFIVNKENLIALHEKLSNLNIDPDTGKYVVYTGYSVLIFDTMFLYEILDAIANACGDVRMLVEIYDE